MVVRGWGMGAAILNCGAISTLRKLNLSKDLKEVRNKLQREGRGSARAVSSWERPVGLDGSR